MRIYRLQIGPGEGRGSFIDCLKQQNPCIHNVDHSAAMLDVLHAMTEEISRIVDGA